MIPTNAIVTIHKSGGELDEWGKPIEGITQEVKARINYKSEVVVNQEGKEVVGKGSLYIKDFTEIGYTDKISFVDPSGNTVVESPISIQYKADLSGKVLITKAVF